MTTAYACARRALVLSLATAAACSTGTRLLGADTVATWNSANAPWSTAADWSSNPNVPNNNSPPGTLYDVVINNGNVSLDISPEIQLLNFNNGTISGAGTLTVDGLFTWEGGTLSAKLLANGGISVVTANAVISGGSLTNASGQVTNFSNSTLFLGSLASVPGTFVNNGTFTVRGTTSAIVNNGGTANSFVNNGIINANGSGNLNFNTGIAFLNNGTLNANSGTVTIGAAEPNVTGTTNVASGALLFFNGANHSFAPGSAITGTGNVYFGTGALMTLNGSYSVTGTTTLANATLVGTVTLAMPGLLNWDGGTVSNNLIANAGIAVIAANAVIDGGTVTNASGQLTNFSNSSLFLGNNLAAAGVFINNGTFTVTGTSSAIVNNGGTANAYINNGIINANGSGNLNFNTGIAFVNNGTLNANSGTVTIGAAEINVTGTTNVASGALLFINGAKHSFAPGSVITGTGNVYFGTGAVVTLNGTYSVTGTTTLAAVTLASSNTVTIPGLLNWAGATVSTNLIANAGISIVSANPVIAGGTVTNAVGQLTNSSNSSLYIGTSLAIPGVFINNGTYLANGTSDDIVNNGGTANSFINNGVINANPNTTFNILSGLKFTNNGTLNVNTGTTVINADEPASTGDYHVAAGATLVFNDGIHNFLPGSSITGAGNLTFNSGGVININGNYNITGVTTLDNATLASNNTLNINGLLSWAAGTVSTNLLANAGISVASSNAFITGGTVTNVSGQIANFTSSSLYLATSGAVGGVYINNGTTNIRGTSGNVINNGGTADIYINNGILNSNVTGTFAFGANITFTNNGTLNVNTGITTISGTVTNLVGTTLVLGQWNVFNTTLTFPATPDITTNNASVTLSGTASSFVRLTTAISTNNADLHFLANRSFSAARAFINNGQLELGGGTFTVNSLDNNSNATLTGFGTIAVRPLNHGLIVANGGTLAFSDGVNGATGGTLQSNTGATLNLSTGASGSNTDNLILQSGTTLLLLANNVLVKSSYTNGAFNTGNAFNKHANVATTSGQIRADGNNSQTLTGNVANGTSNSPSIDFSIIHVGDVVSKTYSIQNAGSSGPAVLYALQPGINGGNITDARLSGTGLASSNVGPVPVNSASSSLTVTFTPTSAGPLSAQTLHIANNFDNITEQTLSITGTAYNYAVAALSKTSGGGVFTLNDSTHATLDFGILNSGNTLGAAFSVLNTATGLSDTLAGSWTPAAPDFDLTGFSSFSNVIAGGSQPGFVVGFTAGTAGFFNETVTLHPSSQNSAPFNGPLPDLILTLKAAVNPLPAIWNGAAGNWSNPAGWTSNPNAPQNGVPATALWAVTINNGPVTLDINAAINSLTLAGTTNAWTGKLNFTTNALAIRTTPATKAATIATLQNQILSGKNGGAWNGPGITSSTILTTPNTTLALVDNNDLHLTSFRGLLLDNNSLILVQAHLGDATLDNKVDALDLNILAAHWQQPSGALWSTGDFNSDGKVDALDLNLLAANWQFASLESQFASLESVLSALSLAQPAPAGIQVPEPATLVCLLGLLPAFLRRRASGRTWI